MPLRFTLSLFLLVSCLSLRGQVYTEKQSRHRFAQLNLGMDFEWSPSFQIDGWAQRTHHLPSTQNARILIGGTHFWGHADFLIAIPLLKPTVVDPNHEISFRREVETQFKYYPWRIRDKKVRPFIGISLTSFTWRLIDIVPPGYPWPWPPEGPKEFFLTTPIVAGLNYNQGNWLWELTYSYQIPTEGITASTAQPLVAPVIFNFSMRYMLETTLSAESNWESGKTRKATEGLGEAGKLDGFFVGAGFSSAFWNQEDQNGIHYSFGQNENSTMPEFSLGYYFFKPDISLNLAYRSYSASNRMRDISQRNGRQSLAFEAVKGLFDYHGFVPFLGPFVSWERLTYESTYKGAMIYNQNEQKLAYGLTFGWDILPNRLQSVILRTNLRWTPNLHLDVDGARFNYAAVEFNFIQLIVFPERMF